MAKPPGTFFKAALRFAVFTVTAANDRYESSRYILRIHKSGYVKSALSI